MIFKKNKILFSFWVTLLFWLPRLAGAQVSSSTPNPLSGILFKPSIGLPIEGSPFSGATTTIGPDSIGQYINTVYRYGGMLAGIAAMFMLVYAGWVWLFAAGNSSKISQAQDTIRMTLIGLAFLFGGYLLLSLISTNLVKFKSLEIKKPAMVTGGVCTKDSDCISGYSCLQKYYVDAPTTACGFWVPYVADHCNAPSYNGQYSVIGHSADCKCATSQSDYKIECEMLVYDPNTTNLDEYCKLIRLDSDTNYGCGGYNTREACRGNVCIDKVTREGSIYNITCGINTEDYNSDYWGDSCKYIEDVSCESNDDCNTGGKGVYCCDDRSVLTDYCRPENEPGVNCHTD